MIFLKLKTTLKTILPQSVYTFLRKLYNFFKIVIHLQKVYEMIKTSNFKKPIFKEINILEINFNLLLKPNQSLDKHFYAYGIKEKNIFRLIYENLSKDSIFIDIGSNIGMYTNFTAQLYKKVYGFEPIKYIYEQNLASIKKNNFSNVELYPYGVGQKNTEKEINFINGHEGLSSFFSEFLDESKLFKQKVKIIALDEFLKKKVEKVDLVKIDVEGYEGEVVSGMKNIINQFRPKIILEFSPKF